MSESGVTYEQLLAFAAGELADEQARRVEAYASRHPEAAATIARYRMAHSTVHADDGVDPPPQAVTEAKAIYRPPREPSRAPSLGDAIAQIVARLIYDSRVEPALAGVRGTAAGFQLEYELPETEARLELQADVDEDGTDFRRWRLVGQVTSHESVALRVALCRAGSPTPMVEADADERGVFVMKVDPGVYDLHVHLPDGVVVVSDISMA
jgi:anti-sigma factor RsiW